VAPIKLLGCYQWHPFSSASFLAPRIVLRWWWRIISVQKTTIATNSASTSRLAVDTAEG